MAKLVPPTDAQVAAFQQLSRMRDQMLAIELNLEGTTLAPAVAALLGKTTKKKPAVVRRPKATKQLAAGSGVAKPRKKRVATRRLLKRTDSGSSSFD